jgi:hypothetical protein
MVEQNEDLDELISDHVVTDDAENALVNALAKRTDPSLPPYPRGLILDIVLKTAPVSQLLKAYKLSIEDFKRLVAHPVFRQDLIDMREQIKQEGFSVKVKMQAQSEAYLAEAWRLVHDPNTPANVRADLIKWTFANSGLANKTNEKDSGLDMAKLAEQAKGMDMQTLELRVLNLVMRKTGSPVSPVVGETFDN